MSLPFPDEPIVSDGREPKNNSAGAVSFIDMTGRLNGILYMEDKGGTIVGQPAWIAVASTEDSHDIQRNDSWRGMAVVARGKHYYLRQTELRVEKLAPPDWRYDPEAADWNRFVPELDALCQRIEFLKP